MKHHNKLIPYFLWECIMCVKSPELWMSCFLWVKCFQSRRHANVSRSHMRLAVQNRTWAYLLRVYACWVFCGLHSIQKLASQLSFCAAAEKHDRSRHKGSLVYLSVCIMYINNKIQPFCMRCHFLMFPSCNVNLALSVSVCRLIVPLSWDPIHCGLPSPHSKYPAPRHTHAHLHRSRENTHFNGLRYRYRTRALTFPSASLCSTSVRTTGYPCPPKPHTPHLHINLLFNVILCHSRPICHSASRPPPSSRSIHILHPGPSLVPLSASLTRYPLSPRGVIFFSFNSSFKWNIPLSTSPYPLSIVFFSHPFLRPPTGPVPLCSPFLLCAVFW